MSRWLSARLASQRLRSVLLGAPMGIGALGIGFMAQGLMPGPSGLSGPMLEAVLEAPPQHSAPRTHARDDLQGVAAQRGARGGASLAEPAQGTPLNLEIRVAVERQATQVQLSATGPWWLRRRDGSVIERGNAGQPLTVSLGDALPAEIWLESSDGEAVLLNGRAYAGRLRVLYEAGGLLVVNHLPLEQYVASVVGAEMPSFWNLEALKAQAVAARSYALAHMARPANAHWHLGDTTRWQAYHGLSSSRDRWSDPQLPGRHRGKPLRREQSDQRRGPRQPRSLDEPGGSAGTRQWRSAIQPDPRALLPRRFPGAAAPGSRLVTLLGLALERSDLAEASGALVPLRTEAVDHPGWPPFLVRRLLSRTPKHLRSGGPKPNPFLPWDPDLEVQSAGPGHVVILNKFPVQRGHLLLITTDWQPQSGWLRLKDWQALAAVEAQLTGLWFFNSCTAAGASQPHRHLQLLPRRPDEASCPLAAHCLAELDGSSRPWPWAYALSRRQSAGTVDAAAELESLYRQHASALGLGQRTQQPVPCHPYNILLDRDWFMTVRRTRDDWAGFSVNALGFAGYLLISERSDQHWLQRHGPLQLLQSVACPRHGLD